MKRFALIAILLLAAHPAKALVIDHLDRGAWNERGGYDGSKNALIGNLAPGVPTGIKRAFSLFRLTGFSGTATGAVLRLELEGYNSIDPTLEFTVYDVDAVNIPSLTDTALSNTLGGIDLFTDLGTGTAYGTATVSAADVGSFLDITLSAAAVADINASIEEQSFVAFGLSIEDAESASNPEVLAFGSHGLGDFTHQLIIEEEVVQVPAPATLSFFALALAGIGFQRRKK